MYIAIEIQTNIDKTVGSIILPTSDNFFTINNTYHTALAAAAISTVPKHTVLLFSNKGQLINSESYIHDNTENIFKYLVVEIQTYQNGNVGVLINDYDSIEQANNKYYTILAAAAISELPQHAAVMFDNAGGVIKSECLGVNPSEEEEN